MNGGSRVPRGAATLRELQGVARSAPGCVHARLVAGRTGFGVGHDGRTVGARSGLGSYAPSSVSAGIASFARAAASGQPSFAAVAGRRQPPRELW